MKPQATFKKNKEFLYILIWKDLGDTVLREKKSQDPEKIYCVLSYM